MSLIEPSGIYDQKHKFSILRATFNFLRDGMVGAVKDAPQDAIDEAKATLATLAAWQAETNTNKKLNALYFAIAVLYAAVGILIAQIIDKEG